MWVRSIAISRPGSNAVHHHPMPAVGLADLELLDELADELGQGQHLPQRLVPPPEGQRPHQVVDALGVAR